MRKCVQCYMQKEHPKLHIASFRELKGITQNSSWGSLNGEHISDLNFFLVVH